MVEPKHTPRKNDRGSFPLLSGADLTLLQSRMPGSEGLSETLLRNTPDDRVADVVYILHDWFIANKRADTASIVKYFDQPKEQVDSAISLFIANREELCRPKNLRLNEYPLLQFYLLYDCLIHVGSLKRHVRGVSYLSKVKRVIPRMNVSDFVQRAQNGYIYNYVVVSGDARIDSKLFYHSELANRQPVEASGELSLKRDKDGTIKSVFINDFSGHYRVKGSTSMMTGMVTAALGYNHLPVSHRPYVYQTHDSLSAYRP